LKVSISSFRTNEFSTLALRGNAAVLKLENPHWMIGKMGLIHYEQFDL
jgi:hypothetical protein